MTVPAPTISTSAVSMNDPNESSYSGNNIQRTSLNGVWKLDKTRGEASMRGYLEIMGELVLLNLFQVNFNFDIFDSFHYIIYCLMCCFFVLWCTAKIQLGNEAMT